MVIRKINLRLEIQLIEDPNCLLYASKVYNFRKLFNLVSSVPINLSTFSLPSNNYLLPTTAVRSASRNEWSVTQLSI